MKLQLRADECPENEEMFEMLVEAEAIRYMN